jgi:flavin reductase (DIM6/NTAB) family NADH-FMN oxidoreductase RutF
MGVGQDDFRAALGRFSSGVTILTARDPDDRPGTGGGRDHGMTVSAFCSTSLTPPLVLACIDHSADMHGVLARVSHFGISILTEDQEALSRRFAELPAGRFDGIGYARGESGVVLIDDALAHLECRIADRHEAGDHTIYVGEVERATLFQGRPLIYYRGGYTQLER